jgi:hypothetical protein
MTERGRQINPLYTSDFDSDIEIRQAFIDCVRTNEKIDGKLSDILSQGGLKEPESYHRFSGVNIQYLCYTNKNWESCVMQYPFPHTKVRDEFKEDINPEIRECVEKMKTNFEKAGYSVSSRGDFEYSVEFIPDSILINARVPLTLSNKGAPVIFREDIEIKKESGVYELLMISTSILNYEARYGDADTSPYMLVYPNVGIEKVLRDDGTKIYTLNDRTTGEKFSFAVRSWVMPPGYSL